jgi:hypothetical protein
LSERARTLHRQAAAVAAAAGAALDRYPPRQARYQQQHDLSAKLRAAAASLAPGWLGASLDAVPAAAPLGGYGSSGFLRVGQAHPLDDARFPVVLPLLGTGHLAVDADARDPRVAGLLRSLVLRLLAATPTRSLRILAVDGVGTFAAFRDIDPVMSRTAAGADGLRAVLHEAEARVRDPRRDGPSLLVVITSLPELAEPADLIRIAALASLGPAARVHLIVAGWPPPPLTPESTRAPLAWCTQITVRNPYAWVGDPPGASFGTARTGGRLNAPTYLDPGPPAELVRRVCAQLAASSFAGPSFAGPQPVAGAGSAWSEYLAAARHLDAVRQAPADDVVSAAKHELAALVRRLADQGHRLVPAGVAMAPAPADLYAAQQAMTSPETIRAALVSARATAEAEPTLLLVPTPPPESARPVGSRRPAGSRRPVVPRRRLMPAGQPAPARPRTLLIYGGLTLVAVLAALIIATLALPR